MPKVTKIEVQKNNKERVNIYVDNKYAFAAFIDTIINEGIVKGLELNSEIINKINCEERIKKCKNDAIKTVEKSYKTEKEVIDKLKSKEYTEKEINYAINFLKEYKFIDDMSYAKSYIKSKTNNSGKNKIRYALKRKGISDEIINETLNSINENEELESAMEVGYKKYTSIIKRESDKYKIKNKLCAFLAGRGYDFQTAIKAVNKIMEREL